ncbi:MAG TPA: EamA family transporter [Glaciihabitans sp.]|jgi:drug/metabolite transporter (DMT)-like permease|nr:EamA family transporter [Glaciihabitans sp.]
MNRSSTTIGLVIAVIAAATFGTSGAVIKPLLEAGWSPAATVTTRVLIGGTILLPFALYSLRGNWAALWLGRWRILGMALAGVAGTQLAYYAAIARIPVGTGILIEYMAPLLLVVAVWARSRKSPQAVVLIGSVVALVGLVLVVSPGGSNRLDPLGLVFALLAMVGCALFYVVAARPSRGLPPVALAAFGLLLGGLVLALAGVTRVLPFTASFGQVQMFGAAVAWWVPLLIVGVVGTAVAYASSITAAEILGSRLASFVGLLEVVAATFYAWILLGENLSLAQLAGGALILVGIGFVRSEKPALPLPVAAGDAVQPSSTAHSSSAVHPVGEGLRGGN